MKVSNDIQKSIEKLKGLVEESNNLASLVPSMIDSLVTQVPEKDREEMLKFVKESNGLLEKSKTIDFNKVTSLINDYKLKYEPSTNNEQKV
tara:strand:+ start:135 stop:407 length:273 start_codon:yes stop_codon:yes gene_type:complete